MDETEENLLEEAKSILVQLGVKSIVLGLREVSGFPTDKYDLIAVFPKEVWAVKFGGDSPEDTFRLIRDALAAPPHLKIKRFRGGRFEDMRFPLDFRSALSLEREAEARDTEYLRKLAGGGRNEA